MPEINNPGYGIYPPDDGYYKGDEAGKCDRDGPEDEWIAAIDEKYGPKKGIVSTIGPKKAIALGFVPPTGPHA